jgi:single-strand DNA-binding protein
LRGSTAGSVNKVILIGRLGRDPRSSTRRAAPLSPSSPRYRRVFKDQTGEQQKRTEWHNIVAWKRLAEICGEYLTKGKQVYIEGSIRSRQWDDQSGNKRTSYEIVAREMKMLGSKSDSERSSSQPAAPAPPARDAEEPTASEITDEDIPF